MASEVGICNRALQILGESALISLADNTKAGRSMRLAYEPVRDAEIERHRWGFAIKRASLPALSDEPEHGFDYQYQPPGDFLSLLPGADLRPPSDLSDYRECEGSLFSMENGKILTNVGAPLKIIYKARVTDTGLFPASFCEALSARLAWECCEEITGSDAKVQLAERRYNTAIKEARWANAIQKAPQYVDDESWVMARTM